MDSLTIDVTQPGTSTDVGEAHRRRGVGGSDVGRRAGLGHVDRESVHACSARIALAGELRSQANVQLAALGSLHSGGYTARDETLCT